MVSDSARLADRLVAMGEEGLRLRDLTSLRLVAMAASRASGATCLVQASVMHKQEVLAVGRHLMVSMLEALAPLITASVRRSYL